MAERDETESAEEKEVFKEERPKPKIPLKVLIIAAAALVVALGGVAYFKVLAPRMSGQATAGDEREVAAQQDSQQSADAGEESTTLGPMFQLDAFIVNLADEGGNRYLKARIELEISDEKVAGELENRLPQVRDMILVLLTNKTFAEIRTSRGKARVRDEVITRVNSALTTGEIRQVYFTEFVVQ